MALKLPFVSAVILTHNRKSLVTRAIDSVLSQTYPNMECIVVDDASADGTKELLSARKDIQYIYIPKEESKGGNYARNMGIKASKGEYVAFLDDDDCWLPTKIEKQVALIEKKGCDLVYCGAQAEIVYPDGTIVYQDRLPIEEGQGDLSQKIFAHIYVLNCAMMIRKSALLECGLFDEKLRYWQEYELTMRLAQHSPFFYVNEVLLVFRVDKTDKQRLTNRFDGWRKSTHYIYRKHFSSIINLPFSLKIDLIMQYLFEAMSRCQSSNKKLLYLFYRNVKRLINGPIKLRKKICSYKK